MEYGKFLRITRRIVGVAVEPESGKSQRARGRVAAARAPVVQARSAIQPLQHLRFPTSAHLTSAALQGNAISPSRRSASHRGTDSDATSGTRTRGYWRFCVSKSLAFEPNSGVPPTRHRGGEPWTATADPLLSVAITPPPAAVPGIAGVASRLINWRFRP